MSNGVKINQKMVNKTDIEAKDGYLNIGQAFDKLGKSCGRAKWTGDEVSNLRCYLGSNSNAESLVRKMPQILEELREKTLLLPRYVSAGFCEVVGEEILNRFLAINLSKILIKIDLRQNF